MDYYNPSAFKPKNDWTPGPFTSGQMYGEDRQTYNNLMQMFQSGQATDLAKKKAEFQDYNLSAPVREARRLGDIGLAQKNQFTALPRAQADLQAITDKNKMQAATMDSDIAKTIADNLKGKSDNEMSMVLNDLKKASIAQSVAEQTPGYSGEGQLPVSVTSQLNLSSGMGKMIASSPNPAKVLKGLAEIDPAYIREMAKGKLHNEGQVEVANIQGKTSRDVAGIYDRSRQAIEKSKQELKKETQRVDQEVFKLMKKVSQGQATPEDKSLLQYYQQSAFALRQAAGGVGVGAGATMVPQLQSAVPTMPEVGTLEPGGGQAEEYTVGKIYLGRTGRYRYKGGPVKDPKSWEKVE